MSFLKQNASSFTPYGQVKSSDSYQQDFQIKQFSRLSLNSHEGSSSGRSIRSNASLNIASIPILIQPKSSDNFSLRSRNRKSSVEIEWKNSNYGNMTFLNKSLVGKSSLCRHQEFNLLHQVYEPSMHKQLSEQSCPVGMDQLQNMHSFQKMPKAFQEVQALQYNNIGKQRQKKRFLKTKNLLRNLSSYLHKHIKFNHRCKKFIIKYYKNKNSNFNQADAEQFYQSFVQWTTSLNMSNFQEYQKVWSQKSKFSSIYRQICYKYYRQQLFCDIQSSRLTSKQIILQYTSQFIEGIFNPKLFTHFQNQ